MAEDDLTAPLGAQGDARRQIPIPVIPIIGAAVGVVLVVAALWVLVVDDPLGGEPVAIVALDRPETGATGAATKPGEDPAARNDAPGRPGAKIIAVDPGSDRSEPDVAVSGGDVVITDPTRSNARIVSVGPDQALVDKSRYGPLPRIAADGTRPMDAYRGESPPSAASKPRIAIIVTGLGLSQTGTQEAIRILPSGVTLAFAPYGSSLGRWASKARQDGHETVLQIPLEPFDYPNNDPGPHTLLTSLSQDVNMDRLHWLMARMSGYAGVMNHMGARFTASRPALEAFATEINARGLYFIDDGASSRSLSAQVAEQSGLPFVRGSVALDSTPTKDEIDSRLLQLETVARSQGFTVGVAAALPIVVARIAEWAKSAEARGFALVPASQIAAGMTQ